MDELSDEVAIYFSIESTQVSAAGLTDRLRMRPDRHWAIGDARGKTGKFWERHGWELEVRMTSKENPGSDAAALIARAMATFETRIREMVEPLASLGKSVKTYLILEIRAKQIPGIELSHSFLDIATRLNTSLQIDMMYLK